MLSFGLPWSNKHFLTEIIFSLIFYTIPFVFSFGYDITFLNQALSLLVAG